MIIDIEKYFETSYWILDILPEQVPADGGGQYFAIEKYFLTSPVVDSIYQKFANVILKLNCYYDISVCEAAGDEWVHNPEPEVLLQMVMKRQPLLVLLENAQAMISITGDDHNMTLYNPNDEVLELTSALAAAEGLFVWQPQITTDDRETYNSKYHQ